MPESQNLIEERRLEKLYTYRILDTPDELAFNEIADDLRFTLQVPMALINFVDRNRVWFKACVQATGPSAPDEGPRDVVFCSYTILSDDALIVPDMRLDGRFKDNPLVTGEPHVRAYAGVPLITPDGYRIGTVCCMDFLPRSFTERDREHLQRAARRVMSELDQRLLRREYSSVMQQLQTLMQASPSGFLLLSKKQKILGLNPAAKDISGMDLQVDHPFDLQALRPDPRVSETEPVYARASGEGWFTVTQVIIPGQDNRLLVFEDVSDHIHHQLSLQDMAFKDSLTGLSNRNAFYGMLEGVLQQKDMAVAFLDLDGFKQINDLYGHHAGDALLQEVAQRLKGAVRASDRVFRLAGDEFTLILRGDVSEATLQAIAERILHTIHEPFVFEGQSMDFGISLGITLPRERDTSDSLLSRADKLMYEVKQSGKNNYRMG